MKGTVPSTKRWESPVATRSVTSCLTFDFDASSPVPSFGVDHSSAKCREPSAHLQQDLRQQELHAQAHVTINSLVLLGFSVEQYLVDDDKKAAAVLALNKESFDRCNERLVHTLLHFLLSQLDGDCFPYSIRECWPYLDGREKSRYVHAVRNSLRRTLGEEYFYNTTPNSNINSNGNCNISNNNSSTNSLSNGAARLSVDTVLGACRGKEVWRLLRVLSDQAVQRATDHLLTLDGVHDQQVDADYYMAAFLKDRVDSTRKEGDDSDNEEARLAVAGVLEAVAAAEQQLREAILADLQRTSAVLADRMNHCVEEQREWAKYTQELDDRLRRAQREIDTVERDAHEFRLTAEERHWATPHGDAQRVSALQRIHSCRQSLQSLLRSPLLADVPKHIAEEQSLDASHSLLISADQRQLLSLVEFNKHKANLRHAISLVVDRINQVVSVL
jgi:hypothetical protein